MSDRYCVGIDLGTTNSVVAYVPPTLATGQPRDFVPPVNLLPIAQMVAPGQSEARRSLPSFLFLPREEEIPSLRLDPKQAGGEFPDPVGGVAGAYARSQAADNPQRVVVGAKSWLCQPKWGHTDGLLPWKSTIKEKVSAVQATERFLKHLVAAWHAHLPAAPLDQQHVVLTVPASFDPAARELTRQAAIAAGLPESFVLLEEPQAAIYRYLADTQGRWRETLSPGDALLVVDVGGGTTDLTLVTIQSDDGQVSLNRLAVGNHVLVGGDNMDLALAYQAAEKFRQQGVDLDPWQSASLWHACRDAKERLLDDNATESVPVSVLGRGSSLIGNTVTTEITRQEAAELLMEGFFPKCRLTDRPVRQSSSGFQDIGLPYESDPAITRQVAAFLSDHLPTHHQNAENPGSAALTHLMFNGGVFRSPSLRERLRSTVSDWFGSTVQTIGSPTDLDTSVAIGAAVYAWTKQRGGLRIRGGTAKAYYVGIETAGLAIPGAPRPLRAVCVAAHGMEEGTQSDVPGEQVGAMVGMPARFRFFASSQRTDDVPGQRLDCWTDDELQESEPIELTLQLDSSSDEQFVPVTFESRITELGMFELWCHSVHDSRRWKLEFNTRPT